MSTIYDGTFLDHLAEHIRYLSTASSFWFTSQDAKVDLQQLIVTLALDFNAL